MPVEVRKYYSEEEWVLASIDYKGSVKQVYEAVIFKKR